MKGSMGPTNMNRRKKLFAEQAASRLSDLNKRIFNVELQSKLYKDQSQR